MKKLRVKNSFIPWTFLDFVAREEGVFADNGLEIEFFTPEPSEGEPSDKVSWYTGLVEKGELDTYSVCAWGAIDRMAASENEKIVAASKSSSYAFSIVSREESLQDLHDLANVPIAVNKRTGSDYCLLGELEKSLPYESIELIHGGEPSKRLAGLVEGDFDTASLITPYTQIAEDLGFHKVSETKTVDVLAFVIDKNMQEGAMASYLRSLDEAARRLQENPERFRDVYIDVLKDSFSGFSQDLKLQVFDMIEARREELPITTWSTLSEYPRESFESLRDWMAAHDLVDPSVTYEEVVYSRPLTRLAEA